MNDTLIGSMVAVCIALVGHAGAVWYKIGRIEGKVDVLIRVNNGKEKNDGN